MTEPGRIYIDRQAARHNKAAGALEKPAIVVRVDGEIRHRAHAIDLLCPDCGRGIGRVLNDPHGAPGTAATAWIEVANPDWLLPDDE